MRELSALEMKIYNEGERLIPGVTHDIAELIRHRGTYTFFKKVMEFDLASGNVSNPVRIVDLGCGVGHGCYTLSEIPDSQILGVDFSPESLAYAKIYYSAPNITYQLADLQEYIHTMPGFDYVISRHVFEHIPNGLHLALSTKWRNRVLFEVPYDEPEGNPHHVILGIREENFLEFTQAELFFQDLEGIIYDLKNKPPKPNGVICICGRSDLPMLCNSNIDFPLSAWRPEDREYKSLIEQYLNLHEEHQALVQEHQALVQEHQALVQEHQALQQTRAVIIARKLEEHPLLMKSASVVYDSLAKLYRLFRGK